MIVTMSGSALDHFGEVWGEGDLLSEIGPTLTCIEADALAGLLRALGLDDSADTLIDAHAEEDDAGDSHFRGDEEEE